MDKILKKSLLYDFYGELLTDHQKNIYEQVVVDDLSISEIAANQGISRQGIHDLVKRCEKILEGYENKLHLVERFLSIGKNIKEIEALLNQCDKENEENAIISKVRKLSKEILEEL